MTYIDVDKLIAQVPVAILNQTVSHGHEELLTGRNRGKIRAYRERKEGKEGRRGGGEEERGSSKGMMFLCEIRDLLEAAWVWGGLFT